MPRLKSVFIARLPVLAGLCLLLVSGCRPAVEPQFVTGEAVTALDDELRQAVTAIVLERSGTPTVPRPLADPERPERDVQFGRDLYNKYCQQCHGISGDGRGVAAKFLLALVTIAKACSSSRQRRTATGLVEKI